MAIKKQKGGKSSSSTRPAKMPRPSGPAAKPTRGPQEQDGADQDLDKRELARKNTKPRSARETLKGPNDRKGSTSQKSGKRASK